MSNIRTNPSISEMEAIGYTFSPINMTEESFAALDHRRLDLFIMYIRGDTLYYKYKYLIGRNVHINVTLKGVPNE